MRMRPWISFFCFRDFGAQVALDVQHLLGRLHILLPGKGQGDGLRAAVKDGRAQILLDLLDRLRERGLGDEQLLAGGGDGALVHDGHDIADVLEIQDNRSFFADSPAEYK